MKSMKQRLIVAAIILTWAVLTAGYASAAGTNIPTEFWISTNVTGNFYSSGAGGTLDSPLDGSSQFNFDTNMASLPPNSTIHILAGTYQSGGYYAWQVQNGQKILGSGIDVTILQLPSAIAANTCVVGSVNGGTNMEVADMTCDCNYTSGAYNLTGVLLNGTGNIVRRVKVIHCANYGAVESWGIVVENQVSSLQDSKGNIVEDCEVSHIAGGKIDGISLNGDATHPMSAIVRDNHIDLYNGTTNLNGMGLNGSFIHDSIYEGNLIENAGVGFYGDTGGSTNLLVTQNFFINCTFGVYQRGYNLRNNATYSYNVFQLSPFDGSDAQWVIDIDGGTNINIIGNTAFWPSPGPANSGYFLCQNEGVVSGFIAAGNRVDSSLGNEIYDGSFQIYNNYDLEGNYRSDMNMTTLGGVAVSSLGLDLVSATNTATALLNLGLPSNPSTILTNGTTNVDLTGTFYGNGDGLTNVTASYLGTPGSGVPVTSAGTSLSVDGRVDVSGAVTAASMTVSSLNATSVVTTALASESGQNAVNRGLIFDVVFQPDYYINNFGVGATFNDRSPNNYVAGFNDDITNPPYVPSPDASGITFLNSWPGYLLVATNIGHSLNGLTNFTADFLIQNTNPTSITYPLGFQSPYGANPFLFYYAASGIYGFRINTVNGQTTIQGYNTTGFADGHWHDICLTYNGSTMCIYGDGVLDLSGAASGAFTNVLTSMQVGGYNNDNLAHIRMWNRVLGTNEIYNLAANRGLAAVLYGNGAGITNAVNFTTNAAPTGITWGTTPPDYWIRLTNSATGGPMWTPCWTNH